MNTKKRSHHVTPGCMPMFKHVPTVPTQHTCAALRLSCARALWPLHRLLSTTWHNHPADRRMPSKLTKVFDAQPSQAREQPQHSYGQATNRNG